MNYNEFKRLLCNRIGLEVIDRVTFNHLPKIMESYSKTIPFHNLSLQKHIPNSQLPSQLYGSSDMVNEKEINRDSLIDALLVNQRGGLCYYLNGLFYYFLKESGFNVDVVDSKVKARGFWVPIEHPTLILNHQNNKYIVETSTPPHLPQRPIKLSTGGPIEHAENSMGIKFRFHKGITKHGSYVMDILKPNEHEWEEILATDLIPQPNINHILTRGRDNACESPVSQFGPIFFKTQRDDSMASIWGGTFTLENFRSGVTSTETDLKLGDPKFNELVNRFMSYSGNNFESGNNINANNAPTL